MNVAARVVAPSTAPTNLLAQPAEPRSFAVETLGVRFSGRRTAQGFLTQFDELCSEGQEFYLAEKLLQKFFGTEPRWFYISRIPDSRDDNQVLWDIVLATDRGHKLDFLPQDKTLSLRGRVEGGSLRILSTRLIWLREGQERSSALSIQTKLTTEARVSTELITRVNQLPLIQPLPPDQVAAWQAYIDIQEKIATTRQFCVQFTGHNYGAATRKITFIINPQEAWITAEKGEKLNSEDFWKRALRARNQSLKLFHSGDEDGIELGNLEEVRQKTNQVTVRIEDDVAERLSRGRFTFPATGLLVFSPVGDFAQIRNQRRALKDLAQGKAANYHLARCFFDASQARLPQKIVRLEARDLLLKSANTGQVGAVEKVLMAPDIVLVQGPPGTGKTTIIAEICYQIARQGGRTLIASQTNLAVDNALSRLVHDPQIRMLRKGTPQKTEEEGLQFLENRVIDTWLARTREDCLKRLKRRLSTIEEYHQGLSISKHLKIYIKQEEDLRTKVKAISLQLESKTQQVAREVTAICLQLELQTQQIAEIETVQQAINHWKLGQQMALPKDIADFQVQNLTNLSSEQSHQYLDQVDAWEQLESAYRKIDQAFKAVASLPGFYPTESPSVSSWNGTPQEQLRQLLQHIESAKEDIQRPEMWWKKLIRNFQGKPDPCIYLSSKSKGCFERAYCLMQEQKNLAIQNLNHQISPIKSRHQVEQSLTSSELQHQIIHVKQQIQALEKNAIELERQFGDFTLSLDVRQPLQKLKDKLIQLAMQPQKTQLEHFDALVREYDRVQKTLQQYSNDLVIGRTKWQETWDNISEKFISAFGQVDDPCELSFLYRLQDQLTAWQVELDREEAYLKRYGTLLKSWNQRLENPSIKDCEDLKQLYIDNANVIGITCGQAHKLRRDSKQFRPFDVVIIDEVSKATPPELLIPALLGKKVVMIGDYRQLPPLLEEETLDEVAESINLAPEDLGFMKASWFGQQFRVAPDDIKQWLTIQYRMHPVIMGVINQFYDSLLTCGLSDPDYQRAHHLQSPLFPQEKHLLWVRTPQRPEIFEQKVGTGFTNLHEVEIIQVLCKEIQEAWRPQWEETGKYKEIGIITFYRAQLLLLKQSLNPLDFPGLVLRTATVDRFQGMERPIVIVSMVRNNLEGNLGFARTPERVNVAFSRAQEQLIIVGCQSLFARDSIYRNVTEVVRRHEGFIDAAQLL